MFGLGMPELVVIMVIAVLIFGAGRIADIGGAVGKGIRNFKKSINGTDEITTPAKDKAIEKSN